MPRKNSNVRHRNVPRAAQTRGKGRYTHSTHPGAPKHGKHTGQHSESQDGFAEIPFDNGLRVPLDSLDDFLSR